MEIDFQEKMAAKTNEELLELIGKSEKYVPDAINAAVAELRGRGHEFSQEELDQIYGVLSHKEASRYPEAMSALPNSTTGDLLDWDDMPEYYSQRAIMGFSIVISVLFGAVLLAINLYKKDRKAAFIVAGAGMLGVCIIYSLGSFVKIPLSGTILNGLGGYALVEIFWAKYIGKNARFTPKPIWPPLLVAVVMVVLFCMMFFGFFNL